jgi:acyl-CoA synthetase (AMP-forming)/AMP-acid ligase II
LVPVDRSQPLAGVITAFGSSGVNHVISSRAILAKLLSPGTDSFDFIQGSWFSVDEGIDNCTSISELEVDLTKELKPNPISKEETPFILTLTSGSTGNPKPILLTQECKVRRAHAAMELYGVTRDDITLAATPMHHSLAQRLVLIPMLSGGTSVILPRFSPSIWIEEVIKSKVSFTIAVSSQLSSISGKMQELGIKNIESMRCIVSSSALLDIPTRTQLVNVLNCDFHECYGASEIAIATSINLKLASHKLHSVGTAPKGVTVKIIDEAGMELPAGETGEIACRTTMLFGGYYGKPEQTEESILDGFFKTGDLGTLDEDGYLYFVGRKKELIITGGINVYPLDVESELNKLDEIKECVVFSLPDEGLGEIVAVVIVPTSNSEFNLKSVKYHCVKHLADYQMPRKYFVVDEIPKNAMGKIQRRNLTEMYQNQTAV